MSMKKLKLATLAKNVTTAGTAVPLSATEIIAFDVLITVKDSAGGNIFIGDSTVDNTAAPLTAGESLKLTPPTARDAKENVFDLSKIYIDSSVNGEGVHVTYMVLDSRIA